MRFRGIGLPVIQGLLTAVLCSGVNSTAAPTDLGVDCRRLLQPELDVANWPQKLGTTAESLVRLDPALLPLLLEAERAVREPFSGANQLSLAGEVRAAINRLQAIAKKLIERGPEKPIQLNFWPLPKSVRHHARTLGESLAARARVLEAHREAILEVPLWHESQARGVNTFRQLVWSRLIERIVSLFLPGVDLDQGSLLKFTRSGEIDVIFNHGGSWAEIKAGHSDDVWTIEQMVQQAHRYLSDQHKFNRIHSEQIDEVVFVFLYPTSPSIRRELEQLKIRVIELE